MTITSTTRCAVNQPVQDLDYIVRNNDDYQALRKAWTSLPRIPKLVDALLCPTIYKGEGQTIRLLLKGEESAGSLTVSYVVMEPGAAGASNHHQPLEDELWFCFKGEFIWTIGDKTERVGPGTFGYAPRGVNHAFVQVGDKPSVMFTINTPAGHERGFAGIYKLMTEHASSEAMAKHLADHDFVFEAAPPQ